MIIPINILLKPITQKNNWLSNCLITYFPHCSNIFHEPVCLISWSVLFNQFIDLIYLENMFDNQTIEFCP